MRSLQQKLEKIRPTFLKTCLTSFFLLSALCTFAQAPAEMADTLRSNGKIYVVVTVLATIFAGIFAYLIVLDRRISKMEKQYKVH